MKRVIVLFAFILVFSSCLPLIQPDTMSDTETTLDVNKNITLLPGATVDGVDISAIGGASHAQNTDTAHGIQTADLNMGTFNITNVGLVDGVDVSAITTHTQNTDWILKSSMGGGNLISSGLLADDLRTDRWPLSLNDSNTFFGVGAAGHGNLTDAGGGSEATGNTAIGGTALHAISTGYFNTAIGNLSQAQVTTGIGNTALGENSLGGISTTSFNTAIGTDSLWQNTGSYNTALGMNSGSGNILGSSNVFLGYNAGASELGSNKLYIDNSNTATPLIYGDFSTDTVTINTTLSMAGNITMVGGATVDGVDVSAVAGSSHAQNTDTGLGVLGTKNPPIDNDKFIYRDSAAADALVTSTGIQVKAYLKTYFDTLYTSGAGYVTNPLLDDTAFGIGTGSTASLLYETADANANCIVLALPDGGATDVPILVIGDQGVINKDLGFFDGVTGPRIVVLSSTEGSYAYINSQGLRTSGTPLNLYPGNLTYYVSITFANNVPTLYGTGAYLRVGDAGTTSHSLASEDDLMVSGKFESDGNTYFDGNTFVAGILFFENMAEMSTKYDTDSAYMSFTAHDSDGAAGNRTIIGKLVSSNDPYFQIGRDDTGVATAAVTDMLVLQAGAGTNNETTNFGLGTSWKLGNAASQVEERGSIDLVLTTATDGSEASAFKISTMSAGAMVANALTISASTTATTLTAVNDMNIDTGASKTMVLVQPVYDDMMVDMSNVKTPAANAPSWTAYKNTEIPAFSKSATNILYFTAQVPHRYKEGTDLEFHIHLAYPDNGAGNSIWYFTYSWANRDANYPAASNSGNITVASPTTTDRHQLAEMIATISGAGKTVSSVLLCSISRIGGDVSDTYDNVIYLTSSDFHYQVDTMGSRTATAK